MPSDQKFSLPISRRKNRSAFKSYYKDVVFQQTSVGAFLFTADELRETACVSGAEVQVERRRIHPRAVRARGGAALGEHPAPLRLCGLVVAAGTLERRTHMTPLECSTRSKISAVPRIQPRMSRDPVSMSSRSARVPELLLPVRIRCTGFRFFP